MWLITNTFLTDTAAVTKEEKEKQKKEAKEAKEKEKKDKKEKKEKEKKDKASKKLGGTLRYVFTRGLLIDCCYLT